MVILTKPWLICGYHGLTTLLKKEMAIAGQQSGFREVFATSLAGQAGRNQLLSA